VDGSAVDGALEAVERPLGTYTAFMAIFSAAFGGAIALADTRGRLPERLALADLALAAVAGHKLARLVATDEVTSPIRTPFIRTRLGEDGEVVEEPTGSGVRRAFGELLTCPSCIGQWTCAVFVTGILYRPRAARIAASLFAADAASDFLHTAYRAAKDRA
jgi:Protein of unknown function (DUF1360)